MAAKYCICPACQKRFDRNSEQAVKVGARRYGHAACFPDNQDFVKMEVSQKKIKEADLEELKSYISSLYKDKANWVLITKQIKNYKAKGYSYKGILSTLKYIYEIQNNSIEKSNGGIGLVDYCWEDAKRYYLKIINAQQANENSTFVQKVKEIIIKKPESRRKVKLMNMDWEEDDE